MLLDVEEFVDAHNRLRAIAMLYKRIGTRPGSDKNLSPCLQLGQLTGHVLLNLVAG